VTTGSGIARPPATPHWLLQSESDRRPVLPSGHRTKRSFVDRTLDSGADLLRQVMFSQDVAAERGILQRLDPRVKLLGLLVLLIGLGMVRHLLVLAVAYPLTLVLAAVSRVPVTFFVKRVWLFVPVFAGVMVAPATLSVVTPGRVVLQLWTWHGHPEGISAQGLTSAGLVLARVACSVSLVVLVTVTTPWPRLLAALSTLGVPRIFVLVVGMAYRYVFLLLATVSDLYTARRARTVGAQRHDRGGRAFVGASVGVLFGKAHQLSEEVHQAMVARAFCGRARTLQPFSFTATDRVVAVLVLVAALAIYLGDRSLG
jgi:cobalt/nickel transport system permease protein